MKNYLLVAATLFVGLGLYAIAQDETAKKEAGAETKKSEFTRLTIDLGVVVSDIDAAVEFYTTAIGFQETGGFDVDADFAKYSGLTNGQPLAIKVLKLGNGPGATSLKLMEAEGPSAKANHDYIESTLGVSYLTISVSDMAAAVERLSAASVEPIANGPATIPSTDPPMALTLVRDPDGNLVELVGPAAKR